MLAVRPVKAHVPSATHPTDSCFMLPCSHTGVSGISDAAQLLLLSAGSAALPRDMAGRTDPQPPVTPLQGQGSHLSPGQPPGSTFGGPSTVSARTAKHQLEGSSGGLRSHLLPKEGHRQPQIISAMALLTLVLKISWPQGFGKKIKLLVFEK